LGSLGGVAERDALIRDLERGPRSLRPWCGLALGLLARRLDDQPARDALRKAFASESNLDSAGAFLIASGLAGDPLAIPAQEEVLCESSSALARLNAAQALGLTRDPLGAEALRRALPGERTPLVRIAIVSSLAYAGDEADVPLLLEFLGELRHAGYQPHVACAVGTHGTVAMARGVIDALEETDLATTPHAAAVQGLGILLMDGDPFTVIEACQNTNFTIFPYWLYEPLLTTL